MILAILHDPKNPGHEEFWYHTMHSFKMCNIPQDMQRHLRILGTCRDSGRSSGVLRKDGSSRRDGWVKAHDAFSTLAPDLLLLTLQGFDTSESALADSSQFNSDRSSQKALPQVNPEALVQIRIPRVRVPGLEL